MEKQIEIRTADGIADGFLYTPEGSGPWPGVIQLTDIHGVRPGGARLGETNCSERLRGAVAECVLSHGQGAAARFPVQAGR